MRVLVAIDPSTKRDIPRFYQFSEHELLGHVLAKPNIISLYSREQEK